MKTVKRGHVQQVRASQPLRAAAIVIYVTLALLVVTIPQSMVNWLADMNGNAVQETLLRVAESLQKVCAATGLATPYSRARALFLALRGNEEG